MTTPLSPVVSEFETQEQADSYDQWFRAKVQTSIEDSSPRTSQEEVMAAMVGLIESRRRFRYASD